MDNTIYYANGDRYIGKKENGRKQGYGRLIYTNGDQYVGYFEKNGRGNYVFANNDWYEGNFVNDQFNGHGTFYF